MTPQGEADVPLGYGAPNGYRLEEGDHVRSVHCLFYAAATFLLGISATALLEATDQKYLYGFGELTTFYSWAQIVTLGGPVIFLVCALLFALSAAPGQGRPSGSTPGSMSVPPAKGEVETTEG